MSEQIEDLTREFSPVEREIIIEFAASIYTDKIDKKKTHLGQSIYFIYSGLVSCTVELICNDEGREIFVIAYNVKPDKYEMNGAPITNPSQLKEYLNTLVPKINQ